MQTSKCQLFIFFLFFSFVLKSQTIQDTSLARQYHQQGVDYFKENKMDSCRFFFQLSKKIYVNTSIWDKALENVNWIAYTFYPSEQFDSLGFYLSTNKLIADSLRKVDNSNSALASYWSFFGAYYDNKGDNINKLTYDYKALFIEEQQEKFDSLRRAILLNNIAVSLSYLGDHHFAIDYALKAHSLYPPFWNNEEIQQEGLNILYNLAVEYYYLNQFDKASYFFQQLDSLRQSSKFVSTIDLTKIESSSYLSKIHLAQGDFISSENYLNKAYEVLIKDKEKSDQQLPLLLRDFGTLYKQKGMHKKAEQYYQQALDSSLTLFGFKNNFTSGIFLNYGNLHEDNSQKALPYYQKALTAIVLDFNDSLDIYANPNLEQVCFSKSRLLDILIAKAKALNQNKEIKLALETYQLAIKLIEDLRLNYQAENSKLKIQEDNFFIFEEAINLAIQLNDFNLALAIAEKGKAILLQETIADISSKVLADIPDSLLQKEQVLKLKRGNLERQLFTAQQENNEENTKQLQAQLFETKRAHEKFKESLLQDFPRYYELKYQPQELDIATIQKDLRENEAIIEYFYGQDSIYIFVVTHRQLFVHQINSTQLLLERIDTLRGFMRNYSGNTDDFIAFGTSAYYLFQELVQPALTNLSMNVSNIRIIPDGPIAYIPFQALVKYPLEEAKSNTIRFDTLHYLVKDYCFSYNYSLKLSSTFRQLTTDQFESNFGGFAPVFEGDPAIMRDGQELRRLVASIEEVTVIDSIIGGQLYMNEHATKEQFKSNAQSHKILHLATHATIDDESTMNTRIHFRDDFFTLNEIYGLPIQARLAVLSACETGTGALQKGEGVMSLARAFMYAGCPSILTSLWQVDDQKTADLMIDFYKNLKEGKTQDQALYQAQQTYLTNLNAAFEGHPSYWAAFINIGQQDALFDKGNSYKYAYWLVGLLVLALLVFVGMRFKKG